MRPPALFAAAPPAATTPCRLELEILRHLRHYRHGGDASDANDAVFVNVPGPSRQDDPEIPLAAS